MHCIFGIQPEGRIALWRGTARSSVIEYSPRTGFTRHHRRTYSSIYPSPYSY
jgi:hypothetical protein